MIPNTVSFEELCQVQVYRRIQIPRLRSKSLVRQRLILLLAARALRGNEIVTVFAKVG